MKSIQIKFIMIVFVLSFSCKAQQLQQNNYVSDIVGVWTDEEDNNYRLEFLTNGICKEYEGAEVISSYNYSIEYNSCEEFSAPNVIYLKWVDNENLETTCFEILNITDDTLSLMIIEKGKRLFFNKQQ